MADGVFAPPDGAQWSRVSPKLRTMRRVVLAVIVVAVFGALSGSLASRYAMAALAVAAGGAVLLAWGWWVVGRNWRSWGYTERLDDLLIVHGALYRKLVVVPYGRMQLVDVVAGPVERAFGLVRIKLHTAAATTDASIFGLSPDEAAGLRDRLASSGEAQAAGL